MIGRRRALRAGNALNDAAVALEKLEGNRVVPDGTARYLREAVTIANEIMFQYYLIPRVVRDRYERRPEDGLPVHPVAEE